MVRGLEKGMNTSGPRGPVRGGGSAWVSGFRDRWWGGAGGGFGFSPSLISLGLSY